VERLDRGVDLLLVRRVASGRTGRVPRRRLQRDVGIARRAPLARGEGVAPLLELGGVLVDHPLAVGVVEAVLVLHVLLHEEREARDLRLLELRVEDVAIVLCHLLGVEVVVGEAELLEARLPLLPVLVDRPLPEDARALERGVEVLGTNPLDLVAVDLLLEAVDELAGLARGDDAAADVDHEEGADQPEEQVEDPGGEEVRRHRDDREQEVEVGDEQYEERDDLHRLLVEDDALLALLLLLLLRLRSLLIGLCAARGGGGEWQWGMIGVGRVGRSAAPAPSPSFFFFQNMSLSMIPMVSDRCRRAPLPRSSRPRSQSRRLARR